MSQFNASPLKPVVSQIELHSLQKHYGGWIPKDPEVLKDWIDKEIRNVETGSRTIHGKLGEVQGLEEVIQEFIRLIETDSIIYMNFNAMFAGIEPQDEKGRRVVNNYQVLMLLLDHYIKGPPRYERLDGTDVIGVPIYALLDPLINTTAGTHAFLSPKVNAQFKKMLNIWANRLLSPESCHVLTTDEQGWLSEAALADIESVAGHPFDQAFVCDPTKPYWGFTSWDNFFVRRFREDGPNPPRPVQFPDEDKLINSACDATVYRIATNVNGRDNFWIKGQPYSLQHMLDNNPLASHFTGGTVFQAFLSPFNYHRWNSPINGRVVDAYVVEGSYYGAATDDGGHGALVRSQAFITATAARALIFIECNDPAVGLICFIGVGMGEVSSCDLSVRKGVIVRKGTELGMFHFGGSTHCLVFGPNAKLIFTDTAQPDMAIRVNSVIAQVEG